MKKIILKIGVVSILTILILPMGYALAEEIPDYTVLEKLPGISEEDGTTTLEKYIPAIFNLAIGLSAVIAVLMIVWGGVKYITTDAIMGKQEGKEKIKNAVIALVFVISSWLILYTINPNLINLNLNIESVTTSAPALGGTLAPVSSLSEQITNSCPGCNPAREDLNYKLSQSYINSLSCDTCVPIYENIPLGGNTNTNISPDTNDRLDLLVKSSADDGNWYVSEAYPPVVEHASDCHRNGTCVDISYGTKPPSSNEIKTFINNSSSSGLTSIYEVQTSGEKQSLIDAGVPSDFVKVVPTINNNHFSVYNCFNNNSTSCANLPQQQP